MKETKEQLTERIQKKDYDCRYCWGKGHTIENCKNRKKALEIGLSDQECVVCGKYWKQLGEKKRLEHIKKCPTALFKYRDQTEEPEPNY